MNHSKPFYVLSAVTGILSVLFVLTIIDLIRSVPFGEASPDTTNRDFFQIYETPYPDNAQKKIRWIISHQPERYFLEAALTFKDIIEEKTNGEMTLEIITYKDGIERDQSPDLRAAAKELLLGGEADIMQSYIDEELLTIEPRMTVLEMPLVFRDYDHVTAVVEGPVGRELLQGLDGSPYKGLAFTFSGGFLSFFSNTKSLTSLESLRGTTVPKTDNVVASSFIRALGMTPATGEEKSIDVRRAVYNDFFSDDERYAPGHEGKSLLHTRHSVLFTVLLMNANFFDTLSLEEQKVVTEAAVIAARTEREEIEADEYNFRSLPDQEWVSEPSSEDMLRLSEIAEEVKAGITPRLGSELLAEIQTTR